MESKVKKKFSVRVFLLTIIILFFIAISVLSIIYYISITPVASTKVEKEDMITKTLYTDTDEVAPTDSNINVESYSARYYFDYPREPELSDKIIKDYDNFKEYIEKITNGDKVKFLDENIHSEVLNYFDEKFFTENNLLIIASKPSEYKKYVESIFEENGTATISISEVYNVNSFIIPVGVIFEFIVLSKNINYANVDIYKTSRIYQNANDQALITVLTIIEIILFIVFLIILIVKSGDKTKVEHNNLLSAIVGIVLSLLLFAASFFGVLIYQNLYGNNMVMYKPVIYFYPEKETNINVKVGYPDKLTCSYPKYELFGWNVLAKPNGDLIDLSTKRELYSLYYESNNVVEFKVEDEGFVVRGEEVAKFLEEKLEILGLSSKESEEFIIYWLPKLQNNKYNYIRFATLDEINQNMPIELSVQPDTLIRVLMTYKKLDFPINVKQQKLESVERKGFTVVEWGGTNIK